ncbi:MAG TPA: HAD family hydrolase [Cyclobacteriaceae bacterium]|nr:HAD family hydrolase [Cyclobacteriaceae bacterium]
MSRCIFLDRDGVINEDNPNYTFRVDAFKILPGVIEAMTVLKSHGFILVVVTNQSGIAQGLYTREQMQQCHDYFQQQSGNRIDQFYFSPDHPSVSASLSRKPSTLMFEKAIAKFNIDVSQSWMIGDRGRDIVPARALGIKTIQIGDAIEAHEKADYSVANLGDAAKIILR